MLTGSSQLTRGTQAKTANAFSADRFIPAYAGNSKEPTATKQGTTVHPRLRGELLTSHSGDSIVIGSSPLTRGTHRSPVRRLGHSRFIPAYAGNSSSLYPKCFMFTVHPRLRGELEPTVVNCVLTGGSSPLTRGTLIKTLSELFYDRFIPAYAGNSN